MRKLLVLMFHYWHSSECLLSVWGSRTALLAAPVSRITAFSIRFYILPSLHLLLSMFAREAGSPAQIGLAQLVEMVSAPRALLL